MFDYRIILIAFLGLSLLGIGLALLDRLIDGIVATERHKNDLIH